MHPKRPRLAAQGGYLHAPVWHVCPEAHELPQVPQLALAVCRSAQTPVQSTVPEGHVHWAAVHTRLPPQVCMQKPQLFLSVCRLAQLVPHLARPVPQLASHWPLLQTCPPVHRLPHVPQLPALDVRSTQVCPPPPGPPPPPPAAQAVSPVEQAHVPALQVAPCAHALPQLPQSVVLVDVSTHRPVPPPGPLPVQSVSPLSQPISHVPDTHCSPAPHRLRSLIQDAAHEAGTELKVEVEVTGTNTILELVRKKIGYTVLPSALLHDEIKEGRLQSWPITKPTIVTKLFVATSMQRPQTMATKVVLKAIGDLFAGLSSSQQRSPRCRAQRSCRPSASAFGLRPPAAGTR